MLESEKSGMKVIYGIEAYFVDDEARYLRARTLILTAVRCI